MKTYFWILLAALVALPAQGAVVFLDDATGITRADTADPLEFCNLRQGFTCTDHVGPIQILDGYAGDGGPDDIETYFSDVCGDCEVSNYLKGQEDRGRTTNGDVLDTQATRLNDWRHWDGINSWPTCPLQRSETEGGSGTGNTLLVYPTAAAGTLNAFRPLSHKTTGNQFPSASGDAWGNGLAIVFGGAYDYVGWEQIFFHRHDLATPASLNDYVQGASAQGDRGADRTIRIALWGCDGIEADEDAELLYIKAINTSREGQIYDDCENSGTSVECVLGFGESGLGAEALTIDSVDGAGIEVGDVWWGNSYSGTTSTMADPPDTYSPGVVTERADDLEWDDVGCVGWDNPSGGCYIDSAHITLGSAASSATATHQGDCEIGDDTRHPAYPDEVTCAAGEYQERTVPPYAYPYDLDGDGDVADDDNCLVVAQGGTGEPGKCDINSDGYGNACDADYNGDGLHTGADITAHQNKLDGVGTDADHNCDTLETGGDISPMISTLQATSEPGPSGGIDP